MIAHIALANCPGPYLPGKSCARFRHGRSAQGPFGRNRRRGQKSVTGELSFGSWVSIADPLCAEVMARAGFDWLILDAQHGAVNESNLLGLLQAAELGGAPAYVRVKWNDPAEIMRALDLGAAGVIVPMVSNAEEAHRAAQAVRYPPDGIRSYGRVRSYYGPAQQEGRNTRCFVMVETVEALGNLDAIASTPGVDGMFVGPLDLAISMGFGPTLILPDAVITAMRDIVAAAQRHGVIPGVATLPDSAEAMVGIGMRFLTLGADAGFLRRGAAAEVARAQALKAGQHSALSGTHIVRPTGSQP